MFISKSEFPNHNIPKIIKGIVVPRPIAWVSSVDAEGHVNLAPFSFFTVVSIKPLMIGIVIGKHPDRPKDTLTNIKATGEFVVNIATAALAHEMHTSGDVFPEDVNEFEITGLTETPATHVKIPMIKESPISMECTLHEVYEIGSHNLVVGEVIAFHIDDKVYKEGDYIDASELDTIARMAGDYAHVRDFFFPVKGE